MSGRGLNRSEAWLAERLAGKVHERKKNAALCDIVDAMPIKPAHFANEFAPKKAMQALGRLKPGQQNKTESAYGSVLEARRVAGEIVWYKFEGLRFQLAPATAYTPDYAVMLANGEIELHEVKGFWEDDAKVKIKVASSMYPFRFVAVQKLTKKQGGGWKTVEF